MRSAVTLATVAAREVGVTLRSAAWPLARLRPLPRPHPGACHPPVLLVHGYLGHADMLRPLARRLLQEGWAHVERPSYPSWRWSLDEVVGLLLATLQRLHARHGPVDLVGHSLGAVACRALIKEGGGAPYVRRFVSLGGPHHGTSLFRVVPGPLRAAFDPRGDLIARLNATPEPVPTWVVRAAWDHQVLPPSRASIDGVRERVVQAWGHNGLLWSAEAHEAVIAALTEANP
jgi:pimeloyl-ACP methyl ester carboxylesterase